MHHNQSDIFQKSKQFTDLFILHVLWVKKMRSEIQIVYISSIIKPFFIYYNILYLWSFSYVYLFIVTKINKAIVCPTGSYSIT